MRRLPLHPLLFATFPVLFLFANNASTVPIEKVLLPLAFVVGCGLAVAVVAGLVFRDVRRGAVAASAAIILGLSYGHAWAALEGREIAGLVVGRDLVLLPVWLLLGCAAIVFAWRMRARSEVTAILNAVSMGLVVVALATSSSAVAQQGEGPLVDARPGKRSAPVGDAHASTQRDIYYLIFDRYAGQAVLDKAYGFENEAFLDFLRQREFFIADRSVANYPRTPHSLASSLNMSYLDDLTERYGADSQQWKPLYRKLVGPRASNFLQRQGYTYAHVGSWWDPTASDPTAQLNYRFDKRSEFSRVLAETSIVRPLAKRVDLFAELDGRRAIHDQVLSQFDAVSDASKLPGPTFVFAHILLPHDPYTFDRHGNYVTEDEERRRPIQQSYTDQVRFANSKIQAIIDELLDVPPAERPIIVLQADEGPHPFSGAFGVNGRSWDEASPSELRHKFSILNAYFFPEIADTGLDREITPVNTFRMLFDGYFGTSLGRLPDESYIFGTEKEPYDFERVGEPLEPLKRYEEHR